MLPISFYIEPIVKIDLRSIHKRVDFQTTETRYIFPQDTIYYYYDKNGSKKEISQQEQIVFTEISEIMQSFVQRKYPQNQLSVDTFFSQLAKGQIQQQIQVEELVDTKPIDYLDLDTTVLDSPNENERKSPVPEILFPQENKEREKMLISVESLASEDEKIEIIEFPEVEKILSENKNIDKNLAQCIHEECTRLVNHFDNGVMFIGGGAIPFERILDVFRIDDLDFLEGGELLTGSRLKFCLKDNQDTTYTLNTGHSAWILKDTFPGFLKIDSGEFVLKTDERHFLDKKHGILSYARNYLEERFKKKKFSLKETQITYPALVRACLAISVHHVEEKIPDQHQEK